ncbi:MAG: hypothetical protein C4304_08405 [candidate division GAL15 bacterium]
MASLVGVLLALALMGTAVYVAWRLAAPTWRQVVEEVDLELSGEALRPRPDLPADVGDHDPPPRLSWNWAAAILGPFWYLWRGLWGHFCVLAAVVLLTGGLLAPLVWLYCAVKANEDWWELRKARWSAY